MKIDRRALAGAAVLLAAFPAVAAPGDDAAVTKNIEAYRAGLFAADPKALDALLAPELSYSHSDGHVEDRATFVKNATDGSSKYVSLEFKDVKIHVVGDTAIARFHWIGQSKAVADGKVSDTNLHILTIWQKQAGAWKLLARGSTKL
jgi:ketosteroid isomerase-like protein